MTVRQAALALAISLSVAGVAAAQSTATTTTTTTTKTVHSKSKAVAAKSRAEAVYGSAPTSTSGTADTTRVSGISGTAPATGTTVGTTDTESMNNTPPRSEMANPNATVQTETTVTTTTPAVPASSNASPNATIATTAPGAMADYRGAPGQSRFSIDTNVLDANHDGVLTREEAAGNITLNNQFASIDANADGRLDTGELRSWIASGGLAKNSLPLGEALSGVGMADAFQMLDVNGDGVITAKEAAVDRRLSPRFRSLDRNHDGKLSQAELDAWTAGNKR